MTTGSEGNVSFEILEEIGVITTHATGWSKELNLVSWNGGAPKYDIRDWDPGRNRMSRGITLQEDEMRRVLDLFRKRCNNRRVTSKENAQIEDPVKPDQVEAGGTLESGEETF